MDTACKTWTAQRTSRGWNDFKFKTTFFQYRDDYLPVDVDVDTVLSWEADVLAWSHFGTWPTVFWPSDWFPLIDGLSWSHFGNDFCGAWLDSAALLLPPWSCIRKRWQVDCERHISSRRFSTRQFLLGQGNLLFKVNVLFLCDKCFTVFRTGLGSIQSIEWNGYTCTKLLL